VATTSAPEHVGRWVDWFHRQATPLAEVAASTRWPSDPARTLALLQSTYRHVPAGTPLWLRERSFVDATGPIDVAS
jgi:hypothetical protein